MIILLKIEVKIGCLKKNIPVQTVRFCVFKSFDDVLYNMLYTNVLSILAQCVEHCTMWLLVWRWCSAICCRVVSATWRLLPAVAHTKRVIQQLFPKPPPKIKSDHQHIFPHCESKLRLTILDVRWECLVSCGNSFTAPKPHLHSTKATVKNRSKLGRFQLYKKIQSFCQDHNTNFHLSICFTKNEDIFAMVKFSSENFRRLVLQLALCCAARWESSTAN